MRRDSIRQQIQQQGVRAGAVIALLGILGIPQTVSATVLSSATWNLSRNLTTGGGSLLPITDGGTTVAGLFGNGLALAAGTATERYSPAGNVSLAQGTISFWYQTPADAGSFTVGDRVFMVTTSLGGDERLVDVYYSGSGSFRADTILDGGVKLQYAQGTPSGGFSAGDWLHFTFQYNLSAQLTTLWVGNGTTAGLGGPASSDGPQGVIGPVTFTGDLTSGLAGIWLNSYVGALSYGPGGIWDDLQITNATPYAFNASSIAMPTEPLAADPVPEPSTFLLFGAGGLLLWFRVGKNRA